MAAEFYGLEVEGGQSRSGKCECGGSVILASLKAGGTWHGPKMIPLIFYSHIRLSLFFSFDRQ